MIQIRELKEKDAPLMLEWMHDNETQHAFKKNMLDESLEDATEFCKNASIPDKIEEGQSLHFAIVDSLNDEYMGTISLKKISLVNKNAEYAVVLRKCYRGMGIAEKATKLILDKAFNQYGLHRVYLTVISGNTNASKLYKRCGFQYEGTLKEHIFVNGEFTDWDFYGIIADKKVSE